MTYTADTPIKGNSRGNPAKVKKWLRMRGVGRPNDADAYIDALYEMAPDFGINADVMVAQFVHEASDRATGSIPGQGKPWLYGLNPVGIGVTSDAEWFVYNFVNGRNAALAHLMQLSIYVNGLDLPDGYRIEEPYEAYPPNPAPRWYTTIAATPSRIKSANVLRDLDGMWAVPGKGYGASIARKLDDMKAAGLFEEEDVATSKNWYVINVSGHRSTGDPGDDVERQLTDDLARAYTDEARKRGYRSDWWQRDLDKDSLPDMTKGDLGTVALGVAKSIGASTAPMVLMLDLHFDGRDSVVHAIPPDSVGLKAAVGTAPADDTAANNSLDTRLAADIAASISRATGVGLYPVRRLGIKGVMSERDTRVGETGWRLAMLGATAVYRSRAVRMVIEHGGTTNMTRVSNWAEKCAVAAFDAIDAVYAERNAGGGGGQPPVDPPVDPVDYADPLPIPELSPFIKAGTLVATPPPIIEGASETFVFVGQRVVAKKTTPRKRDTKGDEITGPNINAGESFPALFMQLSTDVGPHWITGWLTRVLVADTEITL